MRVPEIDFKTSETLARVTVLIPEFSFYHGRHVLHIEDLGELAASTLPSKDITQLGTKLVVDPAEIRPFYNLSQKITSVFKAHGTPFMTGYMIGEGMADTLAAEINIIAATVDKLRENLATGFKGKVASWARAHPKWETMLIEAAPSEAYVRNQIFFGVHSIKISPNSIGNVPNLAESRVNNLGQQLINEVADTAAKLWDSSFLGKERVTQRVIKRLEILRDKVNSLAFVDGNIIRLVDYINQVLAKLPRNGPLDGVEFSALSGLVLMLAQPDRIVAQAARLDELHAELTPVPVVPTVQVNPVVPLVSSIDESEDQTSNTETSFAF